MNKSLRLLSDVIGAIGAIVCTIAALTRVSGIFYLGSAEAISVFQGGTGLMVAACLIKLYILERDGRH